MERKQPQPLEIFYCYARKDRALRDELAIHLAGLRRSGLIRSWYDGEIPPGSPWDQAIKARLEQAHIILLLVSPDFIYSDYCYSTEMTLAIERNHKKEAIVIPVLLRPSDWVNTPFSTLQMLPSNALPITRWPDRDEAFADVVNGIRQRALDLLSQTSGFPLTLTQKIAPQLPPNGQGVVENVSRSVSVHTHPSIAQQPKVHRKRDTTLPANQPRQRWPILSRRKLLIELTGGLGVISGAVGIAWWTSLPHPSPPPLYTYSGHSSRVQALAWSPNGRYIASGDESGIVQVWEAAYQDTIFTYRGHAAHVISGSSVNAITWSPDNQYIISAGNDSVQVWFATDGSNVYVYHGGSNGAQGVTCSPDGKRIAAAIGDTVQVWDTHTGANVLIHQAHYSVGAVAWSPDGRWIASCGGDKTAQVWDAYTGGNVFTYRGHSDLVDQVLWSPDGKRVASCSEQTVQIWDAHTGGNVFTWGHSSPVTGIAWSPDGKRIASSSFDQTVQIWDAHTGSNIFIYRNVGLSVIWSPDSKRIACSDFRYNNGNVYIWDAR